jgi:hypothetical protein
MRREKKKKKNEGNGEEVCVKYMPSVTDVAKPIGRGVARDGDVAIR